MSFINILIVAGLIHCALYFFNLIFRTCSHYPYIYFLENTGLEIKLLNVRWYTTAFNRTIVKWTMNKTKFWTMWFNIGAIISLILLPVSLFIIIRMTIVMLSSEQSSEQSAQEWKLEPMIQNSTYFMTILSFSRLGENLAVTIVVKYYTLGNVFKYWIPGINVPTSEIKYQMITIAICSIVHEFGHALAASREDVQLYGVGLILAYVIPVAYVSINNEQLKLLPLQNQLRILCAGVWHNVVLSLVAVCIFYSSSWLWMPLFSTNSGVYVKSMTENSPLLGPKGLLTHDIVYRINDCDVKNNNDWYNCILQAIKQPTPGYCVTQSIIEEYDESIPSWIMVNGAVNCCSSTSISHGSICFNYIESGTQSNPIQLPLHSCLSARPIIEQSNGQCQTTSDCFKSDTHCMKPSLDNTTKIVRLMRQDGKDVLFIGHPVHIYRTIETSDWIPKYKLIDTNLPESMELLCKYVIVLSAGLAVINIIPCFFFDGQYIIIILIQNLFYRTIRSKSTRRATALTITSVVSFLLVINLLHVFMKM